MSFLIGDTMTGGYGKGPDILHDCTIAVDQGEREVWDPMVGEPSEPVPNHRSRHRKKFEELGVLLDKRAGAHRFEFCWYRICGDGVDSSHGFAACVRQ